jgi:hypothetical protein
MHHHKSDSAQQAQIQQELARQEAELREQKRQAQIAEKARLAAALGANRGLGNNNFDPDSTLGGG